MTVTNARGESNSVDSKIASFGVGVFTLDGSGCSQPAVLNVAADGSVSINSPDNAVAPGEFISVFAHRARQSARRPRTPRELLLTVTQRHPTRASPVAASRLPEFWLSGPPPAGQREFLTFAGRAPGLVGVDQFNLRVPGDAVQGCDVGFRFHYPTPLASNSPHSDIVFLPQSQTVPLSIRSGGGRCEPRPADSLAELTWRRLVRSIRAGVTQEDRWWFASCATTSCL